MTTFEELGVAPEITRAISEMGFVHPMAVQEKVIPQLLGTNQDIVALAQTGTGKTAAFGIPMVQQIDPTSKLTQALVLCPTRELCVQITNDLKDYSKYIKGIQIVPVYGGASIDTQIAGLKRGAQIIVATPGRIIDLVNRKAAKLGSVTSVVLDEADEMLNMGFTESINTILAELPEDRQTLLFSATMPNEIAKISKKYMKDAVEITIGSRNAGSADVTHVCYTMHAKDKYQALKRIADYHPSMYGIVFCRTRKDTQEIADKLIQDGYSADSLHGDLSQAQRDHVMQKFRSRGITLLIATDVAARGLDVDDLTHVINYTLPDDSEVYTHRSGRTGRAGKKGISIALINLKEKHLVRQIEKLLSKKFEHKNVPTGREVCEKRLFHHIDLMEKVEVDHVEIDTYLPDIYKKLEWLSKEELIKRFVSIEFNSFLKYYRASRDIEVPTEVNDRKREFSRDNDRSWERDSRGKKKFKFSEEKEATGEHLKKAKGGYTRLFINVGKADGLFPETLIDMINKNTSGPKVPLGKIDLMKNFTYFEVEHTQAWEVIRSMKKVKFRNNKVIIEIAR